MNQKNISNAFQVFLSEAPAHASAWMEAVHKLDAASRLDKKTEELAYLAILASLGLESGVPFHVKSAKTAGASKDEIKSAILLGLPAVGNRVISSLPIALNAFDEEE